MAWCYYYLLPRFTISCGRRCFADLNHFGRWWWIMVGDRIICWFNMIQQHVDDWCFGYQQQGLRCAQFLEDWWSLATTTSGSTASVLFSDSCEVWCCGNSLGFPKVVLNARVPHAQAASTVAYLTQSVSISSNRLLWISGWDQTDRQSKGLKLMVQWMVGSSNLASHFQQQSVQSPWSQQEAQEREGVATPGECENGVCQWMSDSTNVQQKSNEGHEK